MRQVVSFAGGGTGANNTSQVLLGNHIGGGFLLPWNFGYGSPAITGGFVDFRINDHQNTYPAPNPGVNDIAVYQRFAFNLKLFGQVNSFNISVICHILNDSYAFAPPYVFDNYIELLVQENTTTLVNNPSLAHVFGAPENFRVENYYDAGDGLVHLRLLSNGVVFYEFTIAPDPTDFSDPTQVGTQTAFDLIENGADDHGAPSTGGQDTLDWGPILLGVTAPASATMTVTGNQITMSVPPAGPGPNAINFGGGGGGGAGAGGSRRLIFDRQFSRFRNDSVQPTAILAEPDTNLLLYAKQMPQGGYGICYEDFSKDYDDGGWVTGGSPPSTSLSRLPIPMVVQSFFDDQGQPNHAKNYNMLTIDCNPNGQTIHPVLLFDDNNGNVAPVIPEPRSFSGSVRDKFQFRVPPGSPVYGSPPSSGSPPQPGEWGQEGYRAALMLLGNVTAAPEIYQANLYYAILPDWRTVFDSYELKCGIDTMKLFKQAYFDFTTRGSDPLTVKLYADGRTTPYQTFQLPSNPTRLMTPIRKRFVERQCRLWRMTVSSSSAFRLWSPVAVDWKPVGLSGKGYASLELTGTAPQ